MTRIRLGTRRSHLATTQSGLVADQLRALGHEVELVEIVTEGDTNLAPLVSMGGTGVFATAIRHALLTGRIDLAVHSLKDLPVLPYDGLTIAAIPAREDARDALVARDGLTLGELPEGAVIGTGSPRREAQLAALGLGVQVRAIRGNVDTRIGLVTSGEVDAVILARAGLVRLGRAAEITETLEPVQMLPAPGQGALALEIRSDDAELAVAVAALDHADTRAAVTAERALLCALEAGCSAPIGALAEVSEELDGSLEISLRSFVGRTDGSFDLRRSVTGPVETAQQLGEQLAQVLLQDGARDAMSPRPEAPPDPAPGGALPSTTPVTTFVPTSAAECES
ncbi:hydroxymethylbilane synthase [Rudaeicoccus suwonensis]|uniref:Porphobilinogen deaminase n=1 Tax=Rudaeicoccus suwonensis TaxID=657409 RepID=A0A561DU63_9MICO|nr:hydroxymethylbilane synthase [Rudaeicoccus suwonensis]TWE06902.1 hydroxymethylbilane synthase [Rudaeicoccus suwonensis]